MDFKQQYELSRNEEFHIRVRQAMLWEAYNANKEPATGDDVYDNGRLWLATQAAKNPEKWSKIMVYTIVLYPQITANSSDQILRNAIQNVWNLYAGVRTPPA